MKTVLKISTYLFLLLTFACNGTKNTGVKAVTGTAEKAAKKGTQSTVYTLDSGQLNWVGSKALGDSHTGTITLKSGELSVAGNAIQAGDFVIDMASITCTDLATEQGKEKLEGHLKAPDFFDVAQFPTGSFQITSVTPASGIANVTHQVKGNLTLKGTTKSISIPANISVAGDKISAVSPSFSINRTEWGITYGSGSILDLAKDKVINDDIALVLELQASKQVN